MRPQITRTGVNVALPSLEFGPGLVALRRCDGCGHLDRRTWYVTAGQAVEHDARRSTGWRCQACGGEQGTIVRCWFDTVYSER